MQSFLECPTCRMRLCSPSTLICGHSQCAAHDEPCTFCDTPAHGKHDVVLSNILNGNENELEQDLTCHICHQVLYQPTTLVSCQHSFCTPCLHRSLDHNPSCPICRTPIPKIYFHNPPLNKSLHNIITLSFPKHISDRLASIQHDELIASLSTPIFVCQLSFPGLPTILHFFEPRYRLMLRRCLQSPSPRFGMVMSPKPGAPNPDYGTLLDIQSVQSLPDGRSVVQTLASSRFRILHRAFLDGYMVARIESIHDVPQDIPDFPPSIQVLVNTCKAFLARLQQGAAPWVVQRLSSTYGSMPSDPALFSFWVAIVLPIEEQEKAKLLPIKSPRLRLIIVVNWIERLNRNWSVSLFLSLSSHFFLLLLGGSQTVVPSPN